MRLGANHRETLGHIVFVKLQWKVALIINGTILSRFSEKIKLMNKINKQGRCEGMGELEGSILCKPLILKRDISGVFMTQSKCWSPGLLIVSTESLMLPDYKSRGILSFAWAAKVFCTFLCLQFLALWFTLKNFTASFNLNFQLNNAINQKIEESRPPPKFHST